MTTWSPSSAIWTQVGDPSDVDQHARAGQPQLHHRQQRVPAGQTLASSPCDAREASASSTVAARS
jgi:hypothetical protein